MPPPAQDPEAGKLEAGAAQPPRLELLRRRGRRVHPRDIGAARPKAGAGRRRRLATARSGRDLVVRAHGVALDEEAVVLRVVARPLVVVAGERLDRVERVPQREGQELGELPRVAAQHPRAAVAGSLLVPGKSRFFDVRAVRVGVDGANGSPPYSRDHEATLPGDRGAGPCPAVAIAGTNA